MGYGRIDVFARGQDNGLWHKTYDISNGWYGWESLGGYITSDPAVVSLEDGRLDVFARGLDNGLWHIAYYSSNNDWLPRNSHPGWNNWESLGGSLTSGPAAGSWGYGDIQVFARGEDNGLWERTYDKYGDHWRDWYPLGGSLTSGPSVCSSVKGKIDVFVRGEDYTLWHWWNNVIE